MTVLILAQDHDRTADHVVRALQDTEAQVARFDLSWFPQQLDLDAELRDGRWVGQLRTAHRVVDLQVSAGSRKPARTPPLVAGRGCPPALGPARQAGLGAIWVHRHPRQAMDMAR